MMNNFRSGRWCGLFSTEDIVLWMWLMVAPRCFR